MKKNLLLAVAIFWCIQVQATDYTWNFNGSNWNNSSNWTPTGVPGTGDAAIFPELTGTYFVNLDMDVTVRYLELNKGTQLDATLFDLTVTEDLKCFGTNSTIALSASTTLDVSGDLELTGTIDDGTVMIQGNVLMNTGHFRPRAAAIQGNFIWTKGTIGRANEAGNYEINGLLTILDNPSVHALAKKTLSCNGGVLWSGGTITLSDLTTWVIPAGSTFTISGGESVSGSGKMQLEGTMIMNATGLISWNTSFNNQGRLEVNDGIFYLSAGLGNHTGTFAVENGKILRLDGGTQNFNGVDFEGTGTVECTGGTLNLQSDLSVPNLIMNFGILSGTGNLIVTGDFTVGASATVQNVGNISVGDALTWTGGVIGYLNQAPGIVTVSGLTTFSTSIGKALQGKNLILNGGASWTGGSIEIRNGAVIENTSGQTFTCDLGSSTYSIDGSLGSGSFINDGFLVKNGSGTAIISAIFDNTGEINIVTGSLDPDGWSFSHTGVLKGNGTLLGSITNNGIIAPGQSPGTLAIQGGVTSNSSSTIDFEIQHTGSVQKDLLTVSGAATLAGTLNIVVLSGTIPDGTYDIITSTGAMTGTFATVNFPGQCTGDCSINYGANSASFVVSSVLPVELTEFTANKLAREVRLFWSTSSEYGNRGFDVQRSSDGLSWHTLGFIESTGESNNIQHYDFSDSQPLSGVNYYRLKILDEDGHFEFSNMRSVEFESGSIQLFPNPSTGPVFFSSVNPFDFITVTNTSGQLMDFVAGDNPGESFDITHLPSGIYLVAFFSNTQVTTRRLLKN